MKRTYICEACQTLFEVIDSAPGLVDITEIETGETATYPECMIICWKCDELSGGCHEEPLKLWKNEIYRPIPDCQYGNPDDGCCNHPDAMTPECHPRACKFISCQGCLESFCAVTKGTCLRMRHEKRRADREFIREAVEDMEK